jgi:hypothetical protein
MRDTNKKVENILKSGLNKAASIIQQFKTAIQEEGGDECIGDIYEKVQINDV